MPKPMTQRQIKTMQRLSGMDSEHLVAATAKAIREAVKPIDQLMMCAAAFDARREHQALTDRAAGGYTERGGELADRLYAVLDELLAHLAEPAGGQG